ncbi:MAG: sodium/solute symporter [Bacteroidaceae bacterium]|nr:sodium/solute symporter [Bacteroidaceae bacterium]
MSFTEALSRSGFEMVDFVILLVYLVMLVSLGIFLSSNSREGSTKDYFLAGNSLTWWAVSASLIAANVSTEQFIGMAGSGFADGIAIAAYELMAAITLVVIAKWLLPAMMDRKIFTIPQFLRERYNSGVGVAFSILWIFLFVFINLTSVAWLGALAIEQVLGLQGMTVQLLPGLNISMRMIIVISLFLVAGIYSIHSGLTVVAWADVMQMIFIVGGGAVTAYFAVTSVVGNGSNALEGIEKVYSALTTGNHANDTHFHLIIQQSYNEKAFSNVPGIAAVVGSMWLTNLGYWCFNQYIIQKGLAAKSPDDAKKGFLFAGFLKILIPFITVLPGVCAFYMYQHADQYLEVQNRINVSDDAYPWLVRNFIPTGIKGLSLTALIASIISSLASMLNSTATLFTIDIYKKYIKPEASDRRLVNVGRIVSVAALFIALFTVHPLLGDLDQAFQYIQEYSGFIYPGIIIVFSLGLFWKRASTTAAIWTAILAIPLGVLLKVVMPEVPFLFRAGYVFIFLSFFFIVVSLLSKKNESCDLPSERDRHTMLKWSHILGFSGIISILAAAVVSIVCLFRDGEITPEESIFAYLNDIGFEAFYFFGAMLLTCAIFLNSNALHTQQNPKAVPINLALFKTDRIYLYGSIFIIAIVTALYVMLW